MNYFDTSALIKRFAVEPGSPLVDRLAETALVATSKVSYAEVYSGLCRRKRERALGPAAYELSCRQFEKEWPAYVQAPLTDSVLQLARDVIQRHPLRGFDAIHLASALELAEISGEPSRFIAADQKLLEAAKAEGLEFVNVENG